MDISEFYIVVLPLGFLVGVLVLVVLFYAQREEIAQWKLKRLVNSYLRKRVKQKELYTQEVENLKTLLRSGSINKSTYARLKNVLRTSYEQDREEALNQVVSKLGKSDEHRISTAKPT